jgi:hypothetical protein
LLVPDPSLPLARQDLEKCLCLFRLPQHLLSAWWQILEQAQETGKTRLEGFDAFVAAVAGFLAFKDIAVPEDAAFDLLVSKAGQRSIQRPGQPPGLGFTFTAVTPVPVPAEARRSGLWGGINLGDEPTSLLFINLPPPTLLAELGPRHPELSPPGTLGELAEQFLTLWPDYPPVRLRIEPGEGFRFPAGGLLVDGCTLDKDEPDLLLLVRSQESPTCP